MLQRRTIMLKFLLGFVVAVVVVVTAGFCYVRYGFVDPRADLPVDWLESKIAMLPSIGARRRQTIRSSQPMTT
jgi:hypothetical protein